MAFFYRFRAELDNYGSGGPGVSLFHTTTGVADDPGDMGNFMNQMRNGYEGVKGFLINGMTVSINSEVTKHEVETGKLVGVFVVNPPANVVGSGAQTNVSRATQAVCRHNTDYITLRGKRLVGRTFVGPLAGNALDGGGQLMSNAIAALNDMWDGMQDVAGTCRLIVWHRPVLDDEPVDPEYVGAFGHVMSTSTLVRPGSLRSRRDA